jgi:hypothetical protein
MSIFDTETDDPHLQEQYVSFDATDDGAALAELQHELPEELADALRETLEPDETLVFSFPLDMNIAGVYGQQWFVLTSRRAFTWEETDEGFEEPREFSLEDLKDVRLREMTGNHMLFVDRGQGWERLIRSSNMTSWKLKPTRQVLEKVSEDGRATLDDADRIKLKLPEREVCEKCGRAIHPRLGVCVACMNKRQLLGRMLRLLVPYKKLVVACLLLIGVTAGLTVVTPFTTKWITDLVFVPAVKGEAPDTSFWYAFGDPGSMRLGFMRRS